MKVNFKEPLLSLLEGTSAKMPLERPEKKPLASKPLWFCEALLLLMAALLYELLMRDTAATGTDIRKGTVSSLMSSLY